MKYAQDPNRLPADVVDQNILAVDDEFARAFHPAGASSEWIGRELRRATAEEFVERDRRSGIVRFNVVIDGTAIRPRAACPDQPQPLSTCPPKCLRSPRHEFGLDFLRRKEIAGVGRG